MLDDDEEVMIINQDVIDPEPSFRQASRSKALRVNMIYTAALYYAFLAVGVCFSIFNPTLVRLSSILETDLEHVSIIFPVRAVGCTLGTLSNGLLTYYLNRQMLLCCFLLLKSLTIFLVPRWTNVYQFYINGFCNGFVTAAICVMVNVWLNELWSWSSRRRRAKQHGQVMVEPEANKIDLGNVLMQALHFFFGAGCIIGPIISEPFLHFPFSGNSGFWTNNLVPPYTIGASSALLSSIIFFIAFLVCPYQQPQRSKNVKEDNDSGGGSDVTQIVQDDDEVLVIHSSSRSSPSSPPPPPSRWYFSTVIFCSTLFIFVFVWSEGTYFQFSASFAVKSDLHLGDPTAALLASAMFISFTVFRGLSILIALKLSPLTMIYLDLIIAGAGNLLVYIFANRSLPLLTAGYVLLGAGFSSVFPSYFPYLEGNGFTVTDLVGSLLSFASGISLVLAPFVIGLYLDRFPYILVWFAFASVILSSIALTGLNALIVWGKRKRRATPLD